jgi:hypothetical protein
MQAQIVFHYGWGVSFSVVIRPKYDVMEATMTLDEILRDIHAMREDILVFERKYGVPTEVFYEAYQRGEEPPDTAWVQDWSEWAATHEILQERLALYADKVRQLLSEATIANFSQLIERTARHESIAVTG